MQELLEIRYNVSNETILNMTDADFDLVKQKGGHFVDHFEVEEFLSKIKASIDSN